MFILVCEVVLENVSSDCSSILKTEQLGWAWHVWNLEGDKNPSCLLATFVLWTLGRFGWLAGVGKAHPVMCYIVLPFISLL